MRTHSQRCRDGGDLQPFLRWAGGKRKLAPTILTALGPAARLIEPFVGAGAVFAAAAHSAFVLGDRNADLINVYTELKLRPEAFIATCSELFKLPRSRESYLTQRQAFNEGSGLLRAARFLYLNRHGFNGLCRYSNAGNFNVPYGGDGPSKTLDADLLLSWSRKLARAQLIYGDFAAAMNLAQAGDVVYCDPPYLPSRDKSCFTAYAPGGFALSDQVRLAVMAKRLAQTGVLVAVSNHDSGFARELYAGADLYELDVGRRVSAKPESRGLVKEVLAVYRPEHQ